MRGWLFLGLVCMSSAAFAAPGKRQVVDRIVAIVNDSPVTLVDVARLGGPAYAALPPAQQEAQRAPLVQELVETMLIEHEADRLRVEIDGEAVDAALREIAAQSKLTVAQLLDEAQRQGFDPATYRKEIQRQMRIIRTVNLWAASEVTRPDDPSRADIVDPAKARQRMVAALRARAYVEVRP